MKKIIGLLAFVCCSNYANANYPSLKEAKNDYSLYEEQSYYNDTITINDPLESLNRGIHGFNKVLNKTVLAPVSNIYEKTLPSGVRKSVGNSLSNIKEPIYLVNHLLQGKAQDAIHTFWRFFFNSTFGILGIHDFAGTYLNLPKKKNSFEKTLATYCMPHGPYLVLPLYGPSTIRGGIGEAADLMADPINFTNDSSSITIKSGIAAINYRSKHSQQFDDLENLSADDYSMIKSIYSQRIYNRDKNFRHCIFKR
jgi:phospholipid-binding lipoprotein MlaA